MIDSSQQTSDVKAFCGDLEVIGNGIAPSTIDLPLSIKIKDLELMFRFETDDSKEMKIEEKVNGKKLTLILMNFDNSLGSGVIEPVEFGFMDKRKLYLSYWIWTPSKNDAKRIINWTLLQGKEEIKKEE